MKKMSYYAYALIAGVLLSGCGGGSSSSDINSKIGTGYYVDEPIDGAKYVCGSKSGVTGNDGSFLFEIGQGCSFSVGDIILRNVSAAELVDGISILEDNIDALSFLLAIDIDGDNSNGIQIPEDVVNALAESNITNLPLGDELYDLIDELGSKVDGFNGRVLPTEEVAAHIDSIREQVQTQNIKVLLGGKTFYGIENDDGIIEVKFQNDMSSLSYKDPDGETGNEDISVSGYRLNFEDGTYAIMQAFSNTLIVFNEYKADGSSDGSLRLYTDKSDAENYYNSMQQNSDDSNLIDTKDAREMAGYTLIIDDNDRISVTFKQRAYIFEEDCTVVVNDNDSVCPVRLVETNDNDAQFVYDATYKIKEVGEARFLEVDDVSTNQSWVETLDENWHFKVTGFDARIVKNEDNGIVIHNEEPQTDNALTVQSVEDLAGYTISTNTSTINVGGYDVHQQIAVTFNCDGTFEETIDTYNDQSHPEPTISRGDNTDIQIWDQEFTFTGDNGGETLELNANHQIVVGQCWSMNADGTCMNDLVIESITNNTCSN
jgi:hypothetical protein